MGPAANLLSRIGQAMIDEIPVCVEPTCKSFEKTWAPRLGGAYAGGRDIPHLRRYGMVIWKYLQYASPASASALSTIGIAALPLCFRPRPMEAPALQLLVEQ